MRLLTISRDELLLKRLLEHPNLHYGLTAEAAYHYLLGRSHEDRFQEKWRSSSRSLAFWMKKMGFTGVRKGDTNRYFWGIENNDTEMPNPQPS